jgi:hypothetical protein
MSQFPGGKAGRLRAEAKKFKLIRKATDSGRCRSPAAFAVHH